jgi:spermidine synthase
MGTIPIFWTIGGCLLLMAILYWPKCRPLYPWAMIFAALMTAGLAPTGWAQSLGSSLALREKPDPDILYENESQYSYISVRRMDGRPNMRRISQDNMRGGNTVLMSEVGALTDSYMLVYAMVTNRLAHEKDRLSVLSIGGGGYVYPRYIEHVWPGSRIDVVEIDPVMTEAAFEAFGLQKDTPINTIAMDARNYIDELLEKGRNGEEMPRYDFVYGDAFNNYGVPYHLTTKEFNDKIAEILKDDGVYMLNVIDIYDIGKFVGALACTFEQTFADFCVVSMDTRRDLPSSFVFVAAKQRIDTENLFTREELRSERLRLLDDSDIDALKKKAKGMVLTDDYAPVENLLAPVTSSMSSF